MSLIEFLNDWITNYVKSKDIFRQTIVEIKKDKEELVVIHKHKEVKYFMDPFLENIDKNLKLLKESSDSVVVCMNTSENLKSLLAMWKDIIKFRHLAFIFLNPFSKTEKSWTIFPYTHDMIADSATLKSGIKSMFEQVEEVEKDKVEKVYENF